LVGGLVADLDVLVTLAAILISHVGGDHVQSLPTRLGTIALIARGHLLDQIVGQRFRIGCGRFTSPCDDGIVFDGDGGWQGFWHCHWRWRFHSWYGSGVRLFDSRASRSRHAA